MSKIDFLVCEIIDFVVEVVLIKAYNTPFELTGEYLLDLTSFRISL